MLDIRGEEGVFNFSVFNLGLYYLLLLYYNEFGTKT